MTTQVLAGPRYGTVPTEIEIHNSGSRARKRCRWRFSVMDIQGWYPRKRSKALWLGSAIDRALKTYYEVGSRQWQYDNMVGEGIEFPDGPTEHDRAAFSWGVLEEYLLEFKQEDVEDAVTESYDELCDLAREMWMTYLDWAPERDAEIEVITMGYTFRGPIGVATPSELGVQVPLHYGGEIDGLWLIGGKLYVCENKTSSMMDSLIRGLDRDEQPSRYHWAVTQLVQGGVFEHLGVPRDTPVWGTIFNILNKKKPVPIQLNQDGSISKQAKRNRVEDYVDALVERGYVISPSSGRAPAKSVKFAIAVPWTPRYTAMGYEVNPGTNRLTTLFLHIPLPTEGDKVGRKTRTPSMIQADLQAEWEEQHAPAIDRLRELRWVERVLTDRNPATLQQTMDQLYWEAVEELELRLHPERAYRNPTFSCAIDCGIIDVCTAHLKGLPVTGLLEEFYFNKYDPATLAVGIGIEDIPELEDDEMESYAMSIQDVGF